jgi:amino acid transporter
MGLDIRIPLGLVFLIIGGMMGVYGIFTNGNAEMYEKSLGININLVWGGLMFAFGLIMFVFGHFSKPQEAPADAAPNDRPHTH